MCCGLVGVCCFFVWGFGIIFFVFFFFNFFFTHHFVCSSQKQKQKQQKEMVLLHIPCFVQELWNLRYLIRREGLAQAEHILAWSAAQVDGHATCPSMSLQLVLAGDPGYHLGFSSGMATPRNAPLSPSKSGRNVTHNLPGQAPSLRSLALRHRGCLLQGLLLTHSLYRGWHLRVPA